MSNANTVHAGQRPLVFGDRPVGEMQYTVPNMPTCAYTIPNHSGWLVFTRFNSCRAQLRAADGWTQAQAEVMARVLDGEVVL